MLFFSVSFFFPRMEAGLEPFIFKRRRGMDTGGSVWRLWAATRVGHTTTFSLRFCSHLSYRKCKCTKFITVQLFHYFQRFVAFSVSCIGLFLEKRIFNTLNFLICK